MPYGIPTHLKSWLQENMPPTHKMWWMRTVIMDLQPLTVQSPQGQRKSYFRVSVRDIDAKENDKKGYDFDINGAVYKDFRPKDRMNLFGHEPINATHLSFPRFYYNLETTIHGPCYETRFVDRNFFPIPALIADAEGSKRDKKVKFWGGIAGSIGLLPEEIAHRLIGGGFDVEPLYKSISSAIACLDEQEPDAKYPCHNPRPENAEGGALVD